MPSEKVMLAQRVLKALDEGETVVVADALQLRNWAGTPEDALLPLREIAERILSSSQDQKKRAAD